MKRKILVSLVDILALIAVFETVIRAYGVWAALAAAMCTGIYGCFCFWDGLTR